MNDQKHPGTDDTHSPDLHPRHAFWAPTSIRNSLMSFVVFLILAGGFVLWMMLR